MADFAAEIALFVAVRAVPDLVIEAPAGVALRVAEAVSSDVANLRVAA